MLSAMPKRWSIRQIAPTIARVLGAGNPALANLPPIRPVVRAAGTVGKCLVYAVDAVPEWMLGGRPGLFPNVRRIFGRPLRAASTHPSVTPVCFASMFTGASPRRHGLVSPPKRVLRCDSVFDRVLAAGRRAAMVSVKGQSLDVLFRRRAMDHFSERYDPQVLSRTVALVRGGRHDLIVAYNQAYDDAIHASHPTSRRALRALRQYDAGARRLFRAVSRFWAGEDRLFLLVTDHGCHAGPDGRGAHGRRVPADMRVPLFFRVDGPTKGSGKRRRR